ncbi:hypothetical protein lacNasYZ03_11720 [Lactobacillus nasalidis]|uniref:Phage tail protein n=1 Tax=Lactobacillus nasalidis TaxID=2797258 RepID=A0ABQ3W800_9LACO|nr:phage tail tube protein [Lactobacillus nasalidis]GHV97896.1 hypothetical protein lacNasYZ01_10780 [Lactobacillus nasalidis]GHW00126.1 hypothetical protein lacNasYZ02_15550 [Lactobacillus nasalidis]GHW01485.1 hypothetical protein lacNasYZ03_11720 [Lactobacillus nasalidis]
MLFNLQQFATMEGLSSQGTKLEYSEDGTKYNEIPGVKTIPEMGGSPQTIDVTDLASTRQKSIEGLQQSQSLAFQCVYQGDNFKTLAALSGNKKQYKWRVTFGDGTTATFTGSFVIKTDSFGTNAALSFTITITVSDGPDFAPASN